MGLKVENKTFFPDRARDRTELLNSYRHVARTAQNFTKRCKAELVVNGEVVDLPNPLGEILIHAAKALSTWKPITLCPHEELISLQEAADLLGVSRYTVAELCNRGKLPCHTINKYRKVYFAGVIDYLNKETNFCNDSQGDSVTSSKLVKLYEEDPQKALSLIRNIRQK